MRKGTCKFYNGDFHNKCCEAGVEYRTVTTDPDNIDGRAYRKPCVNWEEWNRSSRFPLSPAQASQWEKRGTCEKRQEPSAEEIAKFEAEMNAHTNKFKKIVPLLKEIKTQFRGQSWKGTKPCPVCGGTLHLTHSAYNGHVWGKCETENCVAWAE